MASCPPCYSCRAFDVDWLATAPKSIVFVFNQSEMSIRTRGGRSACAGAWMTTA